MPDWTPTEYAAWWGATIATMVLFWDAYKWLRTGPRLKVRATPNMQLFGENIDRIAALNKMSPDERLINVVVTNVGDQPTTITQFCGFAYRTRIHRVVRRHTKAFVVPTQSPLPLGDQIPHVLGPGERWSNMMKQAEPRRTLGDKGLIYIGVAHRNKYELARVKMSDLDSAGDS